MHPVKHLIITVIVSLVLYILNPKIGLEVIILSAFLTVLIDAVDHAMIILFRQGEWFHNLRQSLMKHKFKTVIQTYYIEKMGKVEDIGFMYLHNIFSMTIGLTIILALLTGAGSDLYPVGVAGLIGYPLHLLCDLLGGLKRFTFRQHYSFWIEKPSQALHRLLAGSE